MIIVDGNDGTGKTTLVRRLREKGYCVADRGLPSKATLSDDEPLYPSPSDVYIILDAPEEKCRTRLAFAGKDLNEFWHTKESLIHFRKRFRKVAGDLNVPLINAGGSADETYANVCSYLGLKDSYRIGVPKGRIHQPVKDIMRMTGYDLGDSDRNYRPPCVGGIEPFILKARSIPQMVAYGLLDGGFCGRDLIAESDFADNLRIECDTGRHPVYIVVLARNPKVLDNCDPSKPLRIATEYPKIASRWAHSNGLSHICINTWGSTEAWVPTFCDIAVDVVETGETAKANGLTIIDEIMESTIAFVTCDSQGLRPSQGLRHHHFVDSIRKLICSKT